MAFFYRKMLVVKVNPNPLEKPPFFSERNSMCLSCLPDNCPDECGDFPPPPPIPHVTSDKYHMPFYFILMFCVLGAVFVFICYTIVLKRYRSNTRIRRYRSQLDENGEEFVIDENLGPVLDHPIWYIRTDGLGQDVIDSISVFKYKKNESLIEGTDCSVCLTEFEEDESLRLLPKCSHAFHIPCIDTWLRSHKNCPLCRAPVVSDVDTVPRTNHVVEVIPITSVGDASSTNEVDQDSDQMEILELVEEGNQETTRGVEDLDDLPNQEGRRMKGVRVFSDLAEHRVKVINNELQPARRSVSMDSSAAAQVIHLAMNEMNLGKIVGYSCSNDQLAEGNKGSLAIMSKRGNKNSSFYKAMKRSFSTSGKSSLPTTSSIQDL